MRHQSASFEDRLETLKESFRNLLDLGSDRAGAIKHRVVDAKDTVVETSGTAARKVGAQIREHPIAAIAIAFGIGYIVMRIMRR